MKDGKKEREKWWVARESDRRNKVVEKQINSGVEEER